MLLEVPFSFLTLSPLENSKNCNFKDFKLSYLKSYLKSVTSFTAKHLCWSLFLIKMRPATLLKQDSNTGVFQLLLPKMCEKTPVKSCIS